MRRRGWLGAVAVVLAAAACTEAGTDPGAAPPPSEPAPTSEPATTTPPTTAPPAVGGDPTVVPDPLPAGAPGELLAVAPRVRDDVPEGARAWDVLHLSSSADGRPVAVSGVVLAPAGPAPAGGRPVLSWAHGTTGVADACAPSRAGLGIPYLGELLAAGYVVAATDYEGLGTPGVHPYLVGGSEGRGVLDVARAARRLPEAGASGDVVVLGHSQGGHAALFAGQLADDHAPDLRLRGVVAGAPVGELATTMGAASGVGFGLGFLASVVVPYAELYDLDPAAVFAPAGLARLGAVEEVCTGDVLASFGSAPIGSLVAASPLDDEGWASRLRENEPGAEPVAGAPVLVIQGTQDVLVPAAFTDETVERLCAVGTAVDYRRYEGADHGTVLTAAAPDVLAFLAARVAPSPPDPAAPPAAPGCP